jgi:hypothetical protein
MRTKSSLSDLAMHRQFIVQSLLANSLGNNQKPTLFIADPKNKVPYKKKYLSQIKEKDKQLLGPTVLFILVYIDRQ